MTVKILFLVPYPLGASPSQRFRFEQYFDLLKKNGYDYRIQSFLDSHNWQVFFKVGNTFLKSAILLKGFLKRVLILFTVRRYTFIFIHREVTPIGPPLFEWLLAKVLRKKIIYDFDDAIWATDRKDESFFLSLVKWRSKVKSICKWSYKISCGNEYLGRYALQYNKHVFINPTTIDTEQLHNPDLYSTSRQREITIGWTGSHSTLKYLIEIKEPLRQIINEFRGIQLLVIADRPPTWTLPSKFIPWNAATEIQDLMQTDIGIMPLPDDEWAKGKCGFKALQYMSLNIPAVASSVGVNTTIIEHGVNGFLTNDVHDWYRYLKKLIEDESLRRKIGKQGRKTVIERYSITTNSALFLSLFA
jgi:glycosyltransferase involved in cell wall biosynthesis